MIAAAIPAVAASSPPNPRTGLWVAALSRISEHPLIGNGPVLQVYFAHPSRQATTHAHNELLQFAVDYGLVGLTLGLAAVAAMIPSLVAGLRADSWLAAAAVTLCATGLVDFGLRITAIALLGAVLLAAACRAGISAANGTHTLRMSQSASAAPETHSML